MSRSGALNFISGIPTNRKKYMTLDIRTCIYTYIYIYKYTMYIHIIVENRGVGL